MPTVSTYQQHLNNNSNNKESINKTHRKLERVKGGTTSRYRVTFSELLDNNDIINKEHKKLTRKENILKVRETPDPKPVDEIKDLNNGGSDSGEQDTQEEYSYAYR